MKTALALLAVVLLLASPAAAAAPTPAPHVDSNDHAPALIALPPAHRF